MPYSILKDFKKKDDSSNKKVLTVEHLILGNDLYALEALKRCLDLASDGSESENESRSESGNKKALLLSSKNLSLEDFSLRGLESLRGENSEFFTQILGTDVPLQKKSGYSLFYKDQDFKSFESRFKPQSLYPSESYFTLPYIKLDLSCYFKTLKMDNEEKQRLLRSSLFEKLTEIDELADSTWKLTTLNGTIYIAKNLYFGFSPYSFFSLFKNLNLETFKIGEILEKMKAPATLLVSWVLPRKISSLEETFFFPLGITYEAGHFIGEFEVNQEGQQLLKFLHFFDNESLDEEELSKRIRSLKKSLRKAFPDFALLEDQGLQESIEYLPEGPIENICDGPFKKFLLSKPNLFFIGQNALLRESAHQSLQNLGPMLRSLKSFSEAPFLNE